MRVSASSTTSASGDPSATTRADASASSRSGLGGDPSASAHDTFASGSQHGTFARGPGAAGSTGPSQGVEGHNNKTQLRTTLTLYRYACVPERGGLEVRGVWGGGGDADANADSVAEGAGGAVGGAEAPAASTSPRPLYTLSCC